MIGISKILTGRATVSRAVRGGRPDMLQFSSDYRPVVVWNVTSEYNLECEHCYASGFAESGRPELGTGEALSLIEEFSSLGVPVLIFSGGEPLMRDDLFELAEYARERDLRVALSTNGTLIDPGTAAKLKSAGFAYVGVSLDGLEATHDRFRRRQGAFQEALSGLREARKAGLRTGVRFTLTRDNFADLRGVLNLVESERFDRFCMYHLVYAGRAQRLAGLDVRPEESRRAVELLISTARDWAGRGVEAEILTADNHADGVLLLRHILENEPARAGEVRRLLEMAGGCSAGRKIAAVDPGGDVRPCQFWSAGTVGNVRERSFGEIWNGGADEMLRALRSERRVEEGSRCGRCAYLDLCRGCRVRAAAAGNGLFGTDPQCYLTDEEIAAPDTPAANAD